MAAEKESAKIQSNMEDVMANSLVGEYLLNNSIYGDELRKSFIKFIGEERKKNPKIDHDLKILESKSRFQIVKKMNIEVYHMKSDRDEMKYFIVNSGYTSRLVKGMGMKLIIKKGPNFRVHEEYFAPKIEAYVKSLKEGKMPVIEKEDDGDEDDEDDHRPFDELYGFPLIIIDTIEGEGIYINPKADKDELIWLLNNIGYTHGVIIFKKGDYLDPDGIFRELIDQKYCAGWPRSMPEPNTIEYTDNNGKKFTVGYISPDCESG